MTNFVIGKEKLIDANPKVSPLEELAINLAKSKGFYGQPSKEIIAEIANDMNISYKRAYKFIKFQSAADYFRTHKDTIALETVKRIEKYRGSIDLGGSYFRGHTYVYFHPKKK